jgi:hypothetical protein
VEHGGESNGGGTLDTPVVLEGALKRAARVEQLDRDRDSKKPWHQGYAWKDCVMCPHPEGVAGPVLGERVVLRMNALFPHLNDGQRIAEYDTLAPELAADVRKLIAILHTLQRQLATMEQLEQKIAEARDVIEAGLGGATRMPWDDIEEKARAFLASTNHLARLASE